MNAAQPHPDPDPPSAALAPAGGGALVHVDRRVRFAPPRERGIGRLMAWNLLGLGLLIGSAAAPALWGGLSALAGVGLVGFGWISELRAGFVHERILRARAGLSRERARATAMLEALAAARIAQPYRMEAAGHAALLSLDRGDVAHAIALVRAAEGDAPRAGSVRVRALEKGLVGELARSILAWLSPGSFSGVAHSSAFALGPEQRAGLSRASEVDEFLDLVSFLRVLESSAEPDAEQALAAWRTCRDGGLARRFRGLFLLARAAAARRVPSLADELERELKTDASARALLHRVFPEFGGSALAESAYREPAPSAEAEGEADRALARVSAPLAVVDAAGRIAGPLEHRQLAFDVMRRALARGVLGSGVVILAGAALGGMIGAWTASVLAGYVGAGVALVSALRGMRTGKAHLRLAPLWRLHPPPPSEWLAELEATPLARGGASALRHEHLLLYVSCVQAEQELAQGRAFSAWSLVEWWARGFSPEHVDPQALHPVAASLVRIAALSGHLTAARRISDALAARPGVRDPSARTAYGSAPSALALARALVFGRAGQWEEAARQLGLAFGLPGVWMAPHDEALYELLTLVARHRTGGPMREPNRARVDAHVPLLRSLAPELLDDLA